MPPDPDILTAFAGDMRLLSGPRAVVFDAVRSRGAVDVLMFDEGGRLIDLDALVPQQGPRARGRPKLGVAAREVTLLPRHWDWLAAQPGGASATLRRLVEAARRDPADTARAAREAAWRFLGAVGGDRPGYEAAGRALFAGDGAGFDVALAGWPADLVEFARRLAGPGLESAP